MAYAQDFEKTYADDNWDRLTPYFHNDAVYEVESPVMGCSLVGPTAILAGIKKSLDGFDRRFDTRKIDAGDDLKVDGNAFSISWHATYTVGDHPAYVLHGKTTATLRDGKIAALTDSYEASSAKIMQDWIDATGFAFDPSYV